jgi:putative transposase
MKFAVIAKDRRVWPVSWLCENAGGFSPPAFMLGCRRGPSARDLADEDPIARIRLSFVGTARTYGARRVWRVALAEGFSCGLHKVERLMRMNALRARLRRRGLPKDRGPRSPAATPTLLGRQFVAEVDRRLHLHMDG